MNKYTYEAARMDLLMNKSLSPPAKAQAMRYLDLEYLTKQLDDLKAEIVEYNKI